jgi:hypothetical protein
MLRGWLGALAFLTVVVSDARASDKPGAFHRVSCAVVKFYVARYSAGAAEAWARSHGATDAEIENARLCLASDAMRTASVAK